MISSTWTRSSSFTRIAGPISSFMMGIQLMKQGRLFGLEKLVALGTDREDRLS
jgi:hypothetical protein